MVGQIIDGFRIIRLIAQGGMAEVYEAHQESLGRTVALKVLLPAFSQQEELVSRFEREGRAAAQLSHPNIIQVFAVGQSPEGRPFLAMEYCPRGSLETWLDQLSSQAQAAPVDQALKITRRIAQALGVAHIAGIVHRDLKPSNILFREDGSPVVADLGIAAVRSSARLTQTGTILGTPHYMSPEQAKGDPVDGRSDLYSLGIILYEMLAGRRPFEAAETPALLHQQVYERPNPLDQVQPGLSNKIYSIVDRCLKKAPEARYQSAAELEAALSDALAIEGVTVTPTNPVRAVVRRSWWLVFGVIILIVILFYLIQLDNSAQPVEQSGINDDATVDVAPVPTLMLSTEAVRPTSTTAPVLASSSQVELRTITQESQQQAATSIPVRAVIHSADIIGSYTNKPPIINGDLNEWLDQTFFGSDHLVYSAAGWDGSQDLSAYWSLIWDETYLYVAVDVIDNLHVQTQTGSQSYRGDSLEIQIDTDLAGDRDQNLLNVDDFQIALSPGNFGDLVPEAHRFRGNTNGQILSVHGHNIIIAAKQNSSGYTIEAAIPWADMFTSPSVDMEFGVALNANDNDAPGTSEQEVQMSSAPLRTLTQPSSWGTLRLSSGSQETATASRSTPTPLASLVFEVRSTQPRNYTGLNVSTGQTVGINYLTGAWRAGALPSWPLVGPDGDPQVSSKGTFPLPTEPLMTLIGGIGDQEFFFVGYSTKQIISHDGPLWLGANDDNFSDNFGNLEVEIHISD